MVLDAASGAALMGVLVRPLASSDTVVHAAGRTTALTAPSGAFRLRVEPGAARGANGARVSLVASRIGFAPETLHVGARDSVVQFRLRRAPLTLGSVVVEGDRALSAASSEAIRESTSNSARASPRRSSCASCPGS